MCFLFGTQGQESPSSSKMIRSTVKALFSGQHFRHDKSMGLFLFRRSRESNSEVISPTWPEIKPIQDFMAVLVCKFDEDPQNPGRKTGLSLPPPPP